MYPFKVKGAVMNYMPLFKKGALILFLIILMLPINLSADNFMKPDPRIWKGEIEIIRTGSAKRTIDNSRNGNIETSSFSRTVNENLVLKVCGQLSGLYVLKATHNLIDTAESESTKKDASENCGVPEGYDVSLGHSKSEIKQPGDSRVIWSKKTVTLYNNNKLLKLMEGSAGASIMMLSGDSYLISAGHKWYTLTKADTVEHEKKACSGKTVSTIHRQRTCPPYQKGDIDTTVSEEGTTTTIVTMPAMPYEFVFLARGKFDPDSGIISGIDTQKSTNGDYKEEIIATWHLQSDDPCPDVFKALQFALAAAEAYANQKIRDFADNGNAYDSLITDNISKTLTGKPFSGRGQDSKSSDAMGVSPKDCGIVGRDKFEEQQKKDCQHPILFKSTLRHEAEHVKQCFKNSEKFLIITDLGEAMGDGWHGQTCLSVSPFWLGDQAIS
ncbi:MAG: hypothetical protein U9N53_06995 [Bacteroidota bacterium]|nr:hypothetical protein [Bacteroidota bacterium]